MKLKIFRKKEESKLEILKIIKRTPGKMHAWVETNKGIFRKQIGKVPAGLLK
jgi:hypothetical protein